MTKKTLVSHNGRHLPPMINTFDLHDLWNKNLQKFNIIFFAPWKKIHEMLRVRKAMDRQYKSTR